MIGIYKITNKQNGKVYIGQSVDIERRLAEHKQVRDIPIDMWVNMLGADAFDYEVLEECPEDELDAKEQIYIQQYHSQKDGYNIQAGGFNNSIGSGSGRAKLTEEDVYKIRKAYAAHKPPREVYKNYAHLISLSQFQMIWQGRSWSHILPEVLTEENKQYYVSEQMKNKASLTLNELLEYRKYYTNHTYKEVFQLYSNQYNGNPPIKETSFRKILTGDVRLNSSYLEVPVYKKSLNRWELNGEPVSTIPESWE